MGLKLPRCASMAPKSALGAAAGEAMLGAARVPPIGLEARPGAAIGPAGKAVVAVAAGADPPNPEAAAGDWAQTKPRLVEVNSANNACRTAGWNRFIDLTLIQNKCCAGYRSAYCMNGTQSKGGILNAASP